MKQIIILLPDTTTPVDIPCTDAFVYTGKLRDCPEWIHDMVEDGPAHINPKAGRSLTISSVNGYLIADPGDIIVCHPIQVIHTFRSKQYETS